MDTEYECPDCGTLHYAPTPVTTCDCRASKIRTETCPVCKGTTWIEHGDEGDETCPRCDGTGKVHAPTCGCHDCFTSRDGQAR